MPETVTESIAKTLIELNPSTVGVLKKIAIALGVVAILFGVAGRRYGWLDYRPGGAAFDEMISPAFTALFVVALLLALRWEIVGGAIAAFAGAALIAFATNQLVSTHAALVVALLSVPALLWLFVGVVESSRRDALLGIAATTLLSIVGFFVGNAVYAHFWGPTHPESTVAALPDSQVEWVWSGAVTTTGGEVRALPRDDYESVRLAVSRDPTLADPTWFEPTDESGRVVGFVLDELDADTRYHYAVEVDGELDDVRVGALRTFPDGAASYTVAIGSCARVGSNGAIFDTVRKMDPLLYLITGDLHYGDNGVNDLERYREVMDLTLSRPAQSALYRSTPIAYVWDDHDYGANDADGNSASRAAAMESYREYVPSYELGGADSAVYQAFTIGRVRYVLTDARSARNLDRAEERGADSMLGTEQKAWFKDEIVEAAADHELVVWINPVPWVADEEAGADHWGGFADERRELADHIADNDIDNLLMISGDAHMLAIDDGTNTDYSTDGYPGFPLLHAAALDRPGSVKGGPYSEGAIGNGGQFASMEVTDDGDAITVGLTGLTWDGDVLMSYEFSTAGSSS